MPAWGGVAFNVPLLWLYGMHFWLAESKPKRNNHPSAAQSPVSRGAQLLAPLCLCCLQGRYFWCCLNMPGQVS